jgi:2-polyprenyl-3-methyl-5-hydroxy-6-metoxy-1,4-benzoquinol methylase
VRYPHHETYEVLYGAYFKTRAPHELLAFAGDFTGKRVLDLCAGNCRAGIAAIEMGAREVIAVEQEDAMLPMQLPLGVSAFRGSVWAALNYSRTEMEGLLDSEWEPFGAVVCQQAINYWLKHGPAAIQILAALMEPGASFVFNTFNRKPPTKPMVKEYMFDGRQYVEMSWLVNGTVHHVQIMEGHEPHTTCFDWISPAEFRKLLKPHFDVTEKRRGNTSIYCCTKV